MPECRIRENLNYYRFEKFKSGSEAKKMNITNLDHMCLLLSYKQIPLLIVCVAYCMPCCLETEAISPLPNKISAETVDKT